jgi:hypothetical protein
MLPREVLVATQTHTGENISPQGKKWLQVCPLLSFDQYSIILNRTEYSKTGQLPINIYIHINIKKLRSWTNLPESLGYAKPP